MYTGLGRPVDPDVKLTMPGVPRKPMDDGAPVDGRGLGSVMVRRARRSPAPSRADSDGDRKIGVVAGIGGELRQARGSGGRTTTGRGMVDSAKNSAIASGWLERGNAVSWAVG